MRRAGHKYPLILYQHIVGRWWFAMIFMGLALFGWAYVEYRQPPGPDLLWPFFLGPFLVWSWQLLIAIGILAILVGVFFWLIRFFAYVQPYPTYLKFVTPFLPIKISYKRIQKTTATEMRYLFSFKSMGFWTREIFSPLATRSALIIDLNGYPISPAVLRLFLSRFFFKDKTPHLVIMVEDWMRFSSELESMRTGLDLNPSVQKKRPRDSILARLPRK